MPEVPLISLAAAEERRKGLPICYLDMEEAKQRAANLRARYQHLINPILNAVEIKNNRECLEERIP
jgi:flagellin-specific chaperone FliS